MTAAGSDVSVIVLRRTANLQDSQVFPSFLSSTPFCRKTGKELDDSEITVTLHATV